jgi:hypothetical protein
MMDPTEAEAQREDAKTRPGGCAQRSPRLRPGAGSHRGRRISDLRFMRIEIPGDNKVFFEYRTVRFGFY